MNFDLFTVLTEELPNLDAALVQAKARVVAIESRRSVINDWLMEDNLSPAASTQSNLPVDKHNDNRPPHNGRQETMKRRQESLLLNTNDMKALLCHGADEECATTFLFSTCSNMLISGRNRLSSRAQMLRNPGFRLELFQICNSVYPDIFNKVNMIGYEDCPDRPLSLVNVGYNE